MCERAITAAIEAALVIGQARDEGRLTRSEFNEAMTDLSMFTAGLIADSDDPAATFREFLDEMHRVKLSFAVKPGFA